MIFKWRQAEPELILCAVRWYLRYSLSFRDVEELLSERGLEADHTTIWRWVQRCGPELEQRLRRHLKPTHKSWRVDDPIEVSTLNTTTPPAVELAEWNLSRKFCSQFKHHSGLAFELQRAAGR